jgi:hypothetical protein
MKSILILQNEIMEYHKPVYNGLAQYYEVVVPHSRPPSVKESDRYREVITPQLPVWRFYLQPRSLLGKMIGRFDVVIATLNWRNRPKHNLWSHRYSKKPARLRRPRPVHAKGRPAADV